MLMTLQILHYLDSLFLQVHLLFELILCEKIKPSKASVLPKLLRQPFADSFIDDGAMNVVVRKLSPMFYIVVLIAESLYRRMNALLYFYFFLILL
jgi:hypothetical protein